MLPGEAVRAYQENFVFVYTDDRMLTNPSSQVLSSAGVQLRLADLKHKCSNKCLSRFGAMKNVRKKYPFLSKMSWFVQDGKTLVVTTLARWGFYPVSE